MTNMSPQTQDLIDALRVTAPSGALYLDSRQVQPGDVFLACPGRDSDGRDFIGEAVRLGACAVVFEGDLTDAQRHQLGDVPGWSVGQLREQLGALASAWWGNPSSALTVIAVTGTNGKTTTAHWLAAALQSEAVPCGVIGTLGVTGADGKRHEGLLTTPDVVSIHRYLAKLRDQGVTHVVMEASSIGLDQQRLDAVDIDVGVFTNLTQDHLDYHGDMAAYAKAKALLFKRPELKHAVINIDDHYAGQMIQNSVAPVLTYGVNNASATLLADAFKQDQTTQQFSLQHDSQSIEVKTPFVGAYTIANMLAVAGVLRVLGWSLTKVAAALQQLPAVAGRLEPVEPLVLSAPLPAVIVDYAHTPDALRNVLDALEPMAKARGGRLWCVVGCGGDRDRQKRALMAQAAQSCADRVVLTSDNPRSEDPELILQEMLSGLADPSDVSVITDRAQAILSTVWQAKPEDVVLIAGKGHERYQEVAGKRYVFDDRHWGQLALLMAHNPPAVQTDTRQLQASALFVALRGDRFDGHDYLATAQQAGAVAAIVQQRDETVSLPQIVLGPTLAALQTLATAWRAHHDIAVIGITGSNGKTTTKEMTAAICRQWVGADQTLSTAGNLNNEIGVPLTLMNLRSHHQVAVVEMGMNHPGEIQRLAAMAQPTVALVLNAQREHQEFMKSVEAVAQENGQVLRALPAHGVAVYPANDTYSDLWDSLSNRAGKQLTFGQQPDAAVRVTDIETEASGSQFTLTYAQQTVPVSLAMAGQHNVVNAAAAAACALAAGASLANAAQALSSFMPVKGRMQVHQLSDARVLIDDTYNANPDSVRVAIDVLAKLPPPRALVLGDMGEVGDLGPQMHTEVGYYAREQAIDYLWAMGQATRASVTAFGEQGRWFESAQALCEHAQHVHPQSMLVKGSRFMAMEHVVHLCLEQSGSNNDTGAAHAR